MVLAAYPTRLRGSLDSRVLPLETYREDKNHHDPRTDTTAYLDFNEYHQPSTATDPDLSLASIKIQ